MGFGLNGIGLNGYWQNWELDQVALDDMALDEMGLDEMAISLPNWYTDFFFFSVNPAHFLDIAIRVRKVKDCLVLFLGILRNLWCCLAIKAVSAPPSARTESFSSEVKINLGCWWLNFVSIRCVCGESINIIKLYRSKERPFISAFPGLRWVITTALHVTYDVIWGALTAFMTNLPPQ